MVQAQRMKLRIEQFKAKSKRTPEAVVVEPPKERGSASDERGARASGEERLGRETADRPVPRLYSGERAADTFISPVFSREPAAASIAPVNPRDGQRRKAA
jgi:hypothetical protein